MVTTTRTIINYLETNNLLADQQHGFREQRSTESAILQFVDTIYPCLEEKIYVAGVFWIYQKRLIA